MVKAAVGAPIKSAIIFFFFFLPWVDYLELKGDI